VCVWCVRCDIRVCGVWLSVAVLCVCVYMCGVFVVWCAICVYVCV